MAYALQEWINEMPDGPTASRWGQQVRLRACDPGPETDVGLTGRSETAVVYPLVRTEIAASAIEAGATEERGRCFATELVIGLTPEQLTDEDGTFAQSPEFAQLAADARAKCP